MNNKTKHCDGNTGIGDVKCRPRMRVWHVQVEEKKIDHVSVKESIGEISQDAGEEQGQRDIAPGIRRSPPHEECDNKKQCKTGNHDKKSVVVLKGTKRCAGIGDVYEMKKAGHDLARLIRIDVAQDKILGQMIERIKRQ